MPKGKQQLSEILSGTETSQFTNRQLITDFSGEP